MQTKVKSFILTTLLFALLSGLKAQTAPPPDNAFSKTQAVSELDGKWYLQTTLLNDSSQGRIPEIRFDVMQNRFSGNTGCNQMSGSFQANGISLHISDKMITTRMFCPGYDELSFLKNLLKTDGYHLKNGWLILTAGDSVISRWSRILPH